MRHLFITIVLIITTISSAQAAEPFALVELFTSEGCSSCPPADQFFIELKDKTKKEGINVFLLGFHITYWNRLGWEDPYSLSEADDRQDMYGEKLRTSLYTPQMVINGRYAFIGSNRGQALKIIQKELKEKPKCQLKLTTDPQGNIEYSASSIPSEAELNLAFFEPMHSTEILRGENKGRKLSHVNIVRSIKTLSLKPFKGEISHEEIPSHLSVIGFIQDTATGEICAATAL